MEVSELVPGLRIRKVGEDEIGIFQRIDSLGSIQIRYENGFRYVKRDYLNNRRSERHSLRMCISEVGVERMTN